MAILPPVMWGRMRRGLLIGICKKVIPFAKNIATIALKKGTILYFIYPKKCCISFDKWYNNNSIER
jgi:hypothetical protein